MSKPVAGYEGLYTVSRNGTVMSLGREITSVRGGVVCKVRYKPKQLRPLWTRVKGRGPRVNLYRIDSGPPRNHYIYDLVLEAFGLAAAEALPGKEGWLRLPKRNSDKLSRR